jgi:hypothetical protein
MILTSDGSIARLVGLVPGGSSDHGCMLLGARRYDPKVILV